MLDFMRVKQRMGWSQCTDHFDLPCLPRDPV